MATNVSSWRTMYGPNGEGFDSNVLDKYTIDTLRDFCERTNIWQEALTAISVVSGTAGYSLTHSTADICRVIKAKFNDELMLPVKYEWLNAYEPEWEDETDADPERYYVSPDKKIYLVYTPSADLASGLDVWVSLKPKLTATTVEDFLWNEHRAAITDGTVSRIMRLNCNPDNKVKYSDYFTSRYELAVARAKIRAERGLSLAPLRGKALGYI